VNAPFSWPKSSLSSRFSGIALQLVAAPINAPVLILGESGTGKEMLAKAIHRRSAQTGGPFVASTGALILKTAVSR